ncbi:MAG: hypothetical protein Fur0040_08800 [Sideroxydans sp.]
MKQWILLLLGCGLAWTAQAEIYKRVDKDGHVTYSSSPMKGARKIELPQLPTVPAQPLPPKTKSGKPSENAELRVSRETQSRRDDTRRKILENELASEEQALAEARLRLQEAQDTPQVYTGSDGKTYRNVSKYEEAVAAAQSEVASHEQNVRALKTELSNLK